jgi:hypothetical protein
MDLTKSKIFPVNSTQLNGTQCKILSIMDSIVALSISDTLHNYTQDNVTMNVAFLDDMLSVITLSVITVSVEAP